LTILRHGIDLVECKRIAGMLERHGDTFLERILTPAERDLARAYRHPVPFVAGRWAAKEAIMKMLGTGWGGGVTWTDMEILPDTLGQPIVQLHDQTARVAAALGIGRVLLSITHTDSHAAASTIGVGK